MSESATVEGGSEPLSVDSADFQRWFQNVAQARYIIRKVFRIVDEQAKREGLDPVSHQALLQICGAKELLSITQVAELIDVVPAFASRVTKGLENAGYVERVPSDHDRRVTLVKMTRVGKELLRSIDGSVRIHVDYFQAQLDVAARLSAMSTFGFYVGLGADSSLTKTINEMIAATPNAHALPDPWRMHRGEGAGEADAVSGSGPRR